MNLESLGQIVGIAGGAAAAFHFAVLRPLQDSIRELRALIRETREEARAEAAKIQQLEVTTARIEERVEHIERQVGGDA